ncbi:MAG: thioredoxin domain-containing protein [Gemmatimonadota bacterium]|jgi:protein-disulfide isomerase
MASRGEQRREARQKGGSEMTKFYYVLGAVAVIGVAAVGYSVGSKALGNAATEPVEVQGLDDMNKLVDMAQGVTRGEENAPITIVEFGDYSCPACGTFALQVQPQVDLQYVQTGKAKFIFYDFPLTSIHPHSFLAARAARCAGDQGKFWEYHDILYKNQNRWATKSSVMDDLGTYADQVGLDHDTFTTCLNSDAHAEVVSANMRLGYELGVDGTPTVMVSEGKGMARRVNDFSFPGIKAVVDDMLQDVNGSSNPGS